LLETFFPTSVLKIIPDYQATKKNIPDCLKLMITDVNAGDVLIFLMRYSQVPQLEGDRASINEKVFT